MKKQSKFRSLLHILLMLAILAVIVMLIWHAFGDTLQGLFKLLVDGRADEIQSYLENEGKWKGIVCTVLLSILQVVSIFFPGIAIQIASGALYGWIEAFLACYFGFVLGNIVVFTFVRRLGDRISDIIDIDSNDKTNFLKEKMKLFRPTLVVAVTNLLPVIPNGIIPYIAAGTPIRYSRFIISLMSTCWIQIFFNCLAGSFLINGQFLFMVFAIGIQIMILAFVAVKGNSILNWINRHI